MDSLNRAYPLPDVDQPQRVGGQRIADALQMVDADIAALLLAVAAKANAADIQPAITAAVDALKGGAPAAYDTLIEIATKLAADDDVIAGILAAIATKANAADVYTRTAVDGLMAGEVTARDAAIVAGIAARAGNVVKQVFTASGNFLKEADDLWYQVEIICGGAGAPKGTATSFNVPGGMPGDVVTLLIPASDLAASTPVVVGAGGLGQSGTSPGLGGDSSFGDYIARCPYGPSASSASILLLYGRGLSTPYASTGVPFSFRSSWQASEAAGGNYGGDGTMEYPTPGAGVFDVTVGTSRPSRYGRGGTASNSATPPGNGSAPGGGGGAAGKGCTASKGGDGARGEVRVWRFKRSI